MEPTDPDLRPPAELTRLFNGQGELTQMPVKAGLRHQLLAWVVTLLPEEEIGEVEVNRLLRPVHPDVAMLRRYLIDEGLVARPTPGRYRRVMAGD